MKTSPVIAVDARTVYRGNRRGTGKNLIDLYRTVAALRPAWQFVMFYQQECSSDPFADIPNICSRRIDIRGDRFNLWEDVRLPLAAWRAGADLLHCPANGAPRWPIVPTVVTIHDLIPLDPRWADERSKSWRNKVMRAARAARHIITPSRFSQGQIVDEFGVTTDNITVNAWAADRSCMRIENSLELKRIRAKYGIHPDGAYVFGFGAADPRKNTARTLMAWSIVPAEVREGIALVLVGIDGPTRQAFDLLARERGIGEACRLHSFADEADLPALISGATMMCCLSLSEGFGLPALDAMACGTPVLAARATSLPEVVGDAAWLVDPENVAEMADGMTRLLTDSALRQQLVERGHRWVAEFTWSATANRLANAFESVLSQR